MLHTIEMSSKRGHDVLAQWTEEDQVSVALAQDLFKKVVSEGGVMVYAVDPTSKEKDQYGGSVLNPGYDYVVIKALAGG